MTQPTHTATAGTLDPSFADGGVLQLPIPEISGFDTEAVQELPNNKILLGMKLSGGVGRPTVIARLNEDGSLDTSFGGQGSGLIEIDIDIEVPGLTVSRFCVLSDGGWLVMGRFSTPTSNGLYLVRYHEDGQVEESFGVKGVVVLPFDDMGDPTYVGGGGQSPESGDDEFSMEASRVSGSKGVAALQQLDGKILLVANLRTESEQQQGILLRLNSDGSTDYTFNGLGYVHIRLEGIDYKRNVAEAVAVQADGKILVGGDFILAGQNDGGVYVTRFDAMGRLDRSFNGGTVTVRHSNLIYLKAIEIREADGSIVAVGEALRDGVRNGMVFVLTEGGFFDFNFNRGQPLFSTLVPQGLAWRCCALQKDGSIIAAGTTGNVFATQGAKALTARFLADGSLDPAFNGTGFTVFDEDETYDEFLQDMTMMAGGRIIECGLTRPAKAHSSDIEGSGWVIRYLA
ncbi:hypothetical protein HNO91_27165 [Pseudomonas corrugata]|uniref:Delta-60 repeat domain-containing protein n=1 Tax=Pseudomonas corrugata TaxID=47879 RepID=A0A7Y6DKA9_9PSED|nr:hypothetical protein [Pseudomonas corrugata]NUT90118.1 hypothetical protein [Pseudomonas corrugata]